MNPIQEAIRHAIDPQHGGASFTLKVHLLTGKMVEVVVQGDGQLTRPRDANVLVFQPSSITFVEVVW